MTSDDRLIHAVSIHDFTNTPQSNISQTNTWLISCACVRSWLSEACCYMAEMGQTFKKPLSGSRSIRTLTSGLYANVIVHGMGFSSVYRTRAPSTASILDVARGIGLQRERA